MFSRVYLFTHSPNEIIKIHKEPLYSVAKII